jgi:hypothetical protein
LIINLKLPDRWFALRVLVVGGVLAPMVYYHHTALENDSMTYNMLYFALEMLVAVCLTFTVFVIELYYKTVKTANGASLK